MKELIENWLYGKRSYTYGVILYKQFGTDEQVKKLLDGPKTDYKERRLVELLQELITADKEPVKPVSVKAYEAMPETKDVVLTALRSEWMPHYTQMNYKRHELDRYLDEETPEAEVKRGTLAMEIISLEQLCMAVWAKRDHYLQHGCLPGKDIGSQDPVIDRFEAAKRIEQLKIYVRRYKNGLKKSPADSKQAALLNKYINELEKLKQLHGSSS